MKRDSSCITNDKYDKLKNSEQIPEEPNLLSLLLADECPVGTTNQGIRRIFDHESAGLRESQMNALWVPRIGRITRIADECPVGTTNRPDYANL